MFDRILVHMTEPRLEYVDPANLISRLNSILDYDVPEISIDSYLHKRLKPSLPGKIDDRFITAKGKYILTQKAQRRGMLGSLLGQDFSANLGYISIETGLINPTGNYGGKYEAIGLRITYPLALLDGKEIPNSCMSITKEVGDCTDTIIERHDMVKHAMIIWYKADFSDVLPTEWFLKNR